ncbi:hypothetical protein NEDG_01612 [Nematocida displodere]|uniref:Uncharacterized protein n=1 Tax=Nematocida displodere TaxID=1805483 RepID=A0A177EJN2_9MICR|nr:hypothetical protein NEDG_01612 [Nematocida displodere]
MNKVFSKDRTLLSAIWLVLLYTNLATVSASLSSPDAPGSSLGLKETGQEKKMQACLRFLQSQPICFAEMLHRFLATQSSIYQANPDAHTQEAVDREFSGHMQPLAETTPGARNYFAPNNWGSILSRYAGTNILPSSVFLHILLGNGDTAAKEQTLSDFVQLQTLFAIENLGELTPTRFVNAVVLFYQLTGTPGPLQKTFDENMAQWIKHSTTSASTTKEISAFIGAVFSNKRAELLASYKEQIHTPGFAKVCRNIKDLQDYISDGLHPINILVAAGFSICKSQLVDSRNILSVHVTRTKKRNMANKDLSRITTATNLQFHPESQCSLHCSKYIAHLTEYVTDPKHTVTIVASKRENAKAIQVFCEDCYCREKIYLHGQKSAVDYLISCVVAALVACCGVLRYIHATSSFFLEIPFAILIVGFIRLGVQKQRHDQKMFMLFEIVAAFCVVLVGMCGLHLFAQESSSFDLVAKKTIYGVVGGATALLLLATLSPIRRSHCLVKVRIFMRYGCYMLSALCAWSIPFFFFFYHIHDVFMLLTTNTCLLSAMLMYAGVSLEEQKDDLVRNGQGSVFSAMSAGGLFLIVSGLLGSSAILFYNDLLSSHISSQEYLAIPFVKLYQASKLFWEQASSKGWSYPRYINNK